MDKERILVVEDDLSNVRGTVALLENQGIAVDIATTVKEARKALRQRPYSLLLVDWTLPLSPGGPSDSDAGGKLVDSIGSGRLGEKNRNIRYFVITKQTDQFSTTQAVSETNLGVLSKLDALAIVARVVDVLTNRGTT